MNNHSMKRCKYIVIINDGTDEIFNMHGVIANTWDMFIDEYEKLMGPWIDNHGEEQYHTYLVFDECEAFSVVLRWSANEDLYPWQTEILQYIMKGAISTKELKEILKT